MGRSCMSIGAAGLSSPLCTQFDKPFKDIGVKGPLLGSGQIEGEEMQIEQ
jgi:hypothetical protein